jgi:NAD(P)H-hydrate epimerase
MATRIVTAEEMRDIDRRATTEFSVPSIVLMENAARGVCEVIEEYFTGKGHLAERCPYCRCHGIEGLGVLVVCGMGNNGGDGLAIARLLANRDAEVRVILLGRAADLKGDPKTNRAILAHCNIELHEIVSVRQLRRDFERWGAADVIVDAIFGTGFKGKPDGIQAEAIELINRNDAFAVAVDIPSGVGADDGRIEGRAVMADATVTMALPKRGLLLYPGRGHCGDVWIADIGVPANQLKLGGDTFLLERADIARALPLRNPAGHKGTFGTTLVIAGSAGFTGAAGLTSMGALRIGCGLAQLGVPASLLGRVEARLSEVVKYGLPETPEATLSADALPQIKNLLAAADSLAIGPGLGTEPEMRDLELEIIQASKIPVVIDADGVSNLAGKTSLLKKLNVPFVLTPHPGELSRLIRVSPDEINADRIEVSRTTARELGGVLVLKGAPTVIATPEGKVFVNPTGNSGLGSGGTGDVLTGMIAGLIAQGAPVLEAAQAGVYLHGLAADLAVEDKTEYSLIAGDLLDYLPKALCALGKAAPNRSVRHEAL